MPINSVITPKIFELVSKTKQALSVAQVSTDNRKLHPKKKHPESRSNRVHFLFPLQKRQGLLIFISPSLIAIGSKHPN